MSKASAIVDAALRKLRVHSEINPADRDSLDYTFEELKSMLSELRDNSIELGCKDPDAEQTELGEPSSVRTHLINMLANRVSDYFQVSAPESVSKGAKRGADHIVRFFKLVRCENRYLSETLPMGQGNSAFNTNSYFEKGQRLGEPSIFDDGS